MKKICSIVLALVMVCSMIVCVFANTTAPHDWYQNTDKIINEYGRMTLTPGTDASSMNFAWVTARAEKMKYGTEDDLSDAADSDVVSIVAVEAVRTVNRVTLSELTAGKYYYSYTVDGEWQSVCSFTVDDTSVGFSVMFCSDPQIGRSGSDAIDAVRNDAYGWNNTLLASRAFAPDYSFILCAGDQVNQAGNIQEYNAFLYPEILRSVPIATAVGNHDFYTSCYSRYFNNPNIDMSDVGSLGGAGYYFSYGNALFVVLNSNNILKTDHSLLLADAVAAYPDAVWRVVMLHHSVYNPGTDSTSLTNSSLISLMDAYDIDLVLSGHEHVYSRTVALTDGIADASGAVYLATGTASGCNYGSIDEEDIDEKYAAYSNVCEPVYSILTFSGSSVYCNSVHAESGDVFDSFDMHKDGASTVQGSELTSLGNKIFAFFESLIQKILSVLHIRFEIFSIGA